MPPDNLIKVIEKSKFKKILDTIIKAIKKFLNIIKNIILLPFNICGKFIMKILKFIKNIFKFFK
jgi:Txe/YoeB family toxin of Txe-Axe toxin-antitoxin module